MPNNSEVVNVPFFYPPNQGWYALFTTSVQCLFVDMHIYSAFRIIHSNW